MNHFRGGQNYNLNLTISSYLQVKLYIFNRSDLLHSLGFETLFHEMNNIERMCYLCKYLSIYFIVIVTSESV